MLVRVEGCGSENVVFVTCKMFLASISVPGNIMRGDMVYLYKRVKTGLNVHDRRQ